jgi:hypothetical protein
MPPPTKTSPPIKTPTYSSTYGRRGTRSTAAPLTLLPITSTLGAAIATTASASTRSIRVYLVITISTRINIVYKRVTNIAKNVRAIDRQFNKFKDSLSKVKDKLAFLRRSVIILIYNTRLPDIEYR